MRPCCSICNPAGPLNRPYALWSVALHAMQLMLPAPRSTCSLVLFANHVLHCPQVMRALGDYLQVKCHACVGGTSVREDTRILQASECALQHNGS